MVLKKNSAELKLSKVMKPLRHRYCHEGWALRDFSKIFLRWGQNWWNCFFPLETKKATFSCWNFQNPRVGSPLLTPMLASFLLISAKRTQHNFCMMCLKQLQNFLKYDSTWNKTIKFESFHEFKIVLMKLIHIK